MTVPKSEPVAARTATTMAIPITVLIVDADAVSRRFIELALEKQGEFQVESALDGSGALEVLAHTQVDAIIADSELIDMNGLQLFRRLTTESRLRAIPFLFLSSDKRVATRILAFEEGVDDFLVKPCDITELAARVKAAVERRRRTLASMRRRGSMLAGRFAALTFPDLVTIIEQSQRSGTLAVIGDRSAGSVHFDVGRVVHAAFANLVGQPAFQALMELDDAQFEFSHEPCAIPNSQRSLNSSATALILESARLIDTRNHEVGRPPEAGKPRRRSPTESVLIRRSLTTPPAIPPGMASQLARAIGDIYSLADLVLHTGRALAKWTAIEHGRKRFHVHVLAAPNEAASAFLALAGAPNERWVVGSLSAEPKALGLTFSLRHELLVDLVHLDIFKPKALQDSLMRAPSLLLIAPPDGDFLAVGTKALVELEQLVAGAMPTAVLGIGDQTLETSLRSLPALREHPRLRAVEGVLGHGQSDLRALLVEGIRLATAAVEAP